MNIQKTLLITTKILNFLLNISGVYIIPFPPPWGGKEIKGHKRGEGKGKGKERGRKGEGKGKGRRREGEGKEKGRRREGEGKGRRRVILLRKLKSNLVRYGRTSLHPWKNDLNLRHL